MEDVAEVCAQASSALGGLGSALQPTRMQWGTCGQARPHMSVYRVVSSQWEMPLDKPGNVHFHRLQDAHGASGQPVQPHSHHSQTLAQTELPMAGGWQQPHTRPSGQ